MAGSADDGMLMNFIDGELMEPLSGETLGVVNPATGQEYTRSALSRESDVDLACQAAARAFPAWRDATPLERSRALLRIADALEERADEIAAIEVENTGKPSHMVAGDEVGPSADQIRFFAGAARHLQGLSAGEYKTDHTSTIRREPIGVCAQVTPWNYPLMMAVWKFAPALAAGNTVVLKPSDTTPASTVALAELASEFLPQGCSTWSVATATPGGRWSPTTSLRWFRSRGAFGQGSRSPPRPHPTSRGCIWSLAGKPQSSSSRTPSDLAEALAEQARNYTTGDPSEEVDYGPLNNPNQLARVSGFLERAPDHARVITGGSTLDRDGYFFPPTVVDGLNQDDEMNQNEIFGPVITLQRFDDEDLAIEWANGVQYGLASSLDQGPRSGDANGQSPRLWLRLDQCPHPDRRRDAPRRVQRVGIRQRPLHLLPRGLHPSST